MSVLHFNNDSGTSILVINNGAAHAKTPETSVFIHYFFWGSCCAILSFCRQLFVFFVPFGH